MSFWEKMTNMDRRWVYLMVALAVIFPFIVPMQFPVSITPEARQLFDAVEALPDSSVVMLTFDLYPSTLAETEPIARAALHHLFRKDCRVLTVTTIPLGGPSIAERVTRDMARQYDKVYGIDYVNLTMSTSVSSTTMWLCLREWVLRLKQSIRRIIPARRCRSYP